MKELFDVSAIDKNPKWENMVCRKKQISKRENDIRSEFYRDYTRIINSRAFRRLKQKTQVFFATRNDHVCTRMEHVNNVSSISFGIARYLGLNEELVMAISAGHDLGHAPFGHSGERIINRISKEYLKTDFWHEKNSLRFIDYCETIQNASGQEENLNLTYAVRDGIVTHCGEIEKKHLVPREEYIDLEDIQNASSVSPYTYEGCVVKASDIIAYLGRDIEDALRLRILNHQDMLSLDYILKQYKKAEETMNNSTIINSLVTDLCLNSRKEHGICFSDEGFMILKEIKAFNYEHIYRNKRLRMYEEYAKLIIQSLFDTLMSFYKDGDTLAYIKAEYAAIYPELSTSFSERLRKYSIAENRPDNFKNIMLYNLESRDDYTLAVVDYISSMTDMYAKKLFDEITSF
ncbi:MAG: HD domain-containing protein [Clostridia bacterium]|jgi:dGTPase